MADTGLDLFQQHFRLPMIADTGLELCQRYYYALS